PCPASLPSLSSVVSPTAPTEIYTLSLHDALPIWGFADQLSFFEVQHAWCTRWTLDRRVVSLHGDFYARFAGAVGLFMFNLDHQVRVDIPVWLLNVEPSVNEVIFEECPDDLGRRVDVRNGLKVPAASILDGCYGAGKGLLVELLGGGSQVSQSCIGQILLGNTHIFRTPPFGLAAGSCKI